MNLINLLRRILNKVQTKEDMNMLNRCLIAVFFVFLTSFAIGQSVDHAEGCAPLEVNFKAEVNLTEYFWDFKAGVISRQKDPTKTFIDAGTYDVELKEGENGRLIKTIQIKVYPKPILIIDPTPLNGCAPLAVNFVADRSIIDGNITVNNYHWTFGDGRSADDVNPMSMNNYLNDGVYDAALTIETDKYNCNITKIFTDTIEVYEVPVARYTTKPSNLTNCDTPFTIHFNNVSTGKGTLTYHWDYGDGTSSTKKDPDDKTYIKEGRFNVVLTVTNEHGCEHEYSRPVTIGSPVILLILPDTICHEEPFIFTNRSSLGRYSWEFEDAVPPTSTMRSPIVTFGTPGLKNVKLTVTSLNRKCSSDTSFQIFVEDPSAEFSSFPTYSCAEPLAVQFTPKNQKGLRYVWTFPDGTTSNNKNPVFNLTDETETEYTANGELHFRTELVITTLAGCIDTFSKVDTIFLPNARFMPDVTKGCAPLDVTFADSSKSREDIISWEWDYGDGQADTKSNGADHSHIYTNPGEYLVTLIVVNSAGCLDTSYQVLIEVGEHITPEYAVDKTEVCPGEPITFTAINNDPRIDAWHFHTDNGRSFHCFQDSSFTWTYDTETGKMDVDLEVEYNGCYSTLSEAAVVNVKGPIAHLDYFVDCRTPFDISFTDLSNDATTITWDFGDSTESTDNILIHKYDTTGDYQVVLKAENTSSGCPISYDTVTVYVRDIKSVISMDTILCDGVEYELNAELSQDASTRCFNGYTWLFSRDRPYTTAKDIFDYTFVGKGDWTVSLESTDINGCRDTATIDVDVFQVRPNFEMDDERFCAPADISFTDLSSADTTIVDWEWDFKDGNTSTDRNPKHKFVEYNEDTAYIVLLIRDVHGCSDTYIKPVTMYKPVTEIFTTPAPPFVCLGDEIEFEAKDFKDEGSYLLFDWDFDNGETGDKIEEKITYKKEGTYQVTLIGTEFGTGCKDEVTVEVIVQLPPQADFKSTIDPDTVGCANSIIRFTEKNASGGSAIHYRKWILGNGQIVEGDNAFSVENSFRKGKYDVTFIAESEYGCRDTITRTYEFIGPEGNFNSNLDTICAGDDILLSLSDTVDVDRWIWEINGREYRNVDPITNEIFATEKGDSSNVILKLYKNNCELIVVNPIYFYHVEADFKLEDSCIGNNRLVNEYEGEGFYEWTFPDGSQSDEYQPFYNFKSSGKHTIELKVENAKYGCRDSIIKDINIHPNPEFEGLDMTICEGDTALLTTTFSLINPIWKSVNGGADISFKGTTEILEGKDKFLFLLEETDVNNCIGFDTVEVLLERLLEIPDFDTTICQGESIILPSEDTYGYYNFTWTDTVPGNEMNAKNPVFFGEKSDTFTLEYISSPLGCFTRNAEFTVTVVDGEFEFPKAFTPNGDRQNDLFNVVTELPLTTESVLRFDVYNRWGEKVYSNNQPANGWNGVYKDKDAIAEVYIYIFEYQLAGCHYVIKGDVTLIR